MTNRSDGVEAEPSWWVLIDKRAAMREQFPSLTKVRHERPGCAADIERKRVFREAAQLKRAAEDRAAWERSVAANERRRLNAELAAYAAQRARRKTA